MYVSLTLLLSTFFFSPNVHHHLLPCDHINCIYERVRKSDISVCKKAKTGLQMDLQTFKKSKNVLVLWFKDSAIKKDAKFYTRFVRGDNLSIEGIREGYLFLVYKKKGEGLDLGVEPPLIKLCRVPPGFCPHENSESAHLNRFTIILPIQSISIKRLSITHW